MKDLHGGNIYKLKREGKGEILDYSSNINPLGVPQKFKEKILKEFEKVERYPDIDYIELREELAKYNKIDLKNIIVGNGATEILFLYAKSMKAKKVVIISPTFAEYERAFNYLDCEIEHYILKETENFKFDVDNFLKRNYCCDVVIICNPNNPTGKFIEIEDVKRLNTNLKKRGTKLCIDEAFIEFVENWKEKTAVNLEDNNIFIVRAITKFFAIPGVRFGYGISFDDEFLKKMWYYKEPWSVNTFAEIAGKTVVKDEEYIKNSENWIKKEKQWFFERLSTIQGIKVYKTETNFILLKLEGIKGNILREFLIELGILVRDASTFRGLNDSYIRLAIKDRENNIKVVIKLKEALAVLREKTE